MRANSLITVIIFTPVLFGAGCTNNPSGPDNGDLYLSGRVENWNPSWFQSELFACAGDWSANFILDSSNIQSDGAFSIKAPLPNAPDSSLKSFVPISRPASIYFTETDGRVFSNTNAKYVRLHLVVHDIPKDVPWELYAQNKSPTTDSVRAVGDYTVEYFYFSDSTAITGSYLVTFNDSLLQNPPSRKSYLTEYDVTVSRGWNAIYTSIISDDSHARTYRVVSNDMAHKTWYAAFYFLYGFDWVAGL